MIYQLSLIFLSLQGEGHFVGYPTCFVRFAGWSVQDCYIREECDEAPEGRLQADPRRSGRARAETNERHRLYDRRRADHYDLIPMVSALHDAGYRAHMETSGARPVLGATDRMADRGPKDMTAAGLISASGTRLKIVIRPEWSKQQAWDIVHLST